MIDNETLLAQLFERNREIKDLKAQLNVERNRELNSLKARLEPLMYDMAKAEKALSAALELAKKAEAYRLGECNLIIPNTWIMCGEGENYCSSACMLHAKFKRAVEEANHWAKAYEELKNAVGKNG